MLSSAAVGVGGDKTTTTASKYDCPTDFKFPGGFVRLIDSAGESSYYKVVDSPKSELLKNETGQICWFTGNKSNGFDLNFLSAPTAGLTIEYPYYKEASYPTAVANVIEMADPMFAIHYALSILHENDGQGDRATLALAKAEAKMKGMRTRNTMPSWWQDNQTPDQDLETGTPGFGM